MESHGQRIAGSRFYRAHCPRCGEPMRVTLECIEADTIPECEQCNPPHIGCGIPMSLRCNSVDGDVDAFRKAWDQ